MLRDIELRQAELAALCRRFRVRHLEVFGLLESLEALFGRHVDLVVASAITNPYFQETVEKSRTLLYAA